MHFAWSLEKTPVFYKRDVTKIRLNKQGSLCIDIWNCKGNSYGDLVNFNKVKYRARQIDKNQSVNKVCEVEINLQNSSVQSWMLNLAVSRRVGFWQDRGQQESPAVHCRSIAPSGTGGEGQG